jgi:O-antigen/teichoic acid export membrane protein
MAASILYLAFFYIDNAAIGKWLGVTALGYYNLAYTICNIPAINITHVVNKVMYPAYSKMNDNVPALRDAYMKTVKSIALVTFPMAIWLFFASHDFVECFFGHKWVPAIPLFRVLAFYGMFRSIGSTAGSVFMAVGQPKWVYRLNCTQLAIAVPLVYSVTIHHGTLGVATLFTAAYITGTSLALWKVVKILGMTGREYVGMFKIPLIASAITITASYAIARSIFHSGLGITISSAVLTLMSYPITAIMLDRETFRTAKSILLPAPTRVYEAVSSGKGSTE